MERITVERTGKRGLVFEGEELAAVDTGTDGDGAGRSHGYKLYRTATGKFVLASEHITCWQGEHDTSDAQVLDDEAALCAFVDEYSDRLLVELLDEAGIDYTETV